MTPGCGCRIIIVKCGSYAFTDEQAKELQGSYIDYCPTHAVAFEMLRMLKASTDLFYGKYLEDVEALIQKAQGANS